MTWDNPTFIGIIVLLLINIGPAISSWKGIIQGSQRRDIGPQPLEVTPAPRYVSREHCGEEMQKNSGQHAELYRLARETGAEVAALSATVNENGKRLERMDAKLDRLLTGAS